MKKKFLCVCQGGNCRSVALAQQLKEAGQDAVAVGWMYASWSTIELLSSWADYVVFMQPWDPAEIFSGPWRFSEKKRVVDVGPDKWFVAQNPELNEIIRPFVVDWSGKGFNI